MKRTNIRPGLVNRLWPTIIVFTSSSFISQAFTVVHAPPVYGPADAWVLSIACAVLLLLGLAIVFGGIALRALIHSVETYNVAALRLVQQAGDSNRAAGMTSLAPLANGSGDRALRPSELDTGPVPPASQASANAPADGERRRQFRLEIAQALLPVIHESVSEFLRVHGADQEAGGMLVGECQNGGDVTVFRVRGFIDAGPKASFSAGSILFDADYQGHRLQALQFEHPGATNLGCVHRHPGSLDSCSAGDALTDRAAVETADTKALIFAIITLNNPHAKTSSVLFRDFKIDFYLMAQETGFEYVPIRPALSDLPLMANSPQMEALWSCRGPELACDLALLGQVPCLGRTVLRAVGEAPEVLLSADFQDTGDTVHLWARSDGAIRAEVRNSAGKHRALTGPWEEALIGKHVWLSHLLLLSRHEGTESGAVKLTGSHYAGLLDNKHRLVAEVRAMRERYGDRATLRLRHNTLLWEYVVHESGRSFPIRIEYPEVYPAAPPRIFSLLSLPSSPHQLRDNELCWIDRFTELSDWNPAHDTAAVCVAAAHRWFACLLVFITTGSWPEGADDK